MIHCRLICMQLVAIIVLSVLSKHSEAVDNTDKSLKKPWFIKAAIDNKYLTCLLASFDADIVHRYNATHDERIPVGKDAYLVTAESYCNASTNSAKLTVHWTDDANKSFALSLSFSRTSNKELIIDQIDVEYYLQSSVSPQLKSLKPGNSPQDFDKFRVKSKYSYKCEKGEGIGLNVTEGFTSISFRNAQWEVFRDSDKDKQEDETKFVNTPKKCDDDIELNYTILVVAAICVAALTGIVIAFVVIGRIRSRRNAKSFGIQDK